MPESYLWPMFRDHMMCQHKKNNCCLLCEEKFVLINNRWHFRPRNYKIPNLPTHAQMKNLFFRHPAAMKYGITPVLPIPVIC